MKKVVIILICSILLFQIFEATASLNNEIKNDNKLISFRQNVFRENIFGNKTFGGRGDDRGYSIDIVDDSGYIIAGYTSSFGNGGEDAWVVKIDSNGNEEWNQTFGGQYSDRFYSIIQNNDRDFVCCGYTSSFGNGGEDAWVVKIDSNGNEEWNQTFGGQYSDRFYCIQKVEDENYVLTGFTSQNYGSNKEDTWLVKISNNGEEIWNKIFGGNYYDYGGSVKQTIDNGFVIVGLISHDPDLYNADSFVIKTNNHGNIIWEKTYGGPYLEYGTDIIQINNGSYIISGVSQQYLDDGGGSDGNIELIKIDSSGNIDWIQSIGDSNYHDFCNSIKQTIDNKYIIVGSKIDFSVADSQVTLTKCDINGFVEWSKVYGNIGEDVGVDVIQTQTGEYVLTGYTSSYSKGDYDVWVILENKFLNQRPSKPVAPIGPSSGKIKSDYFYSSYSIDKDHDSLYFLFDWGDGSNSGWLGPFDSGEECHASHSWERIDEYNIRVKARDIHGGESEWSDPLTISIPKNRFLMQNILSRFLEETEDGNSFINVCMKSYKERNI